VPAPFQIVLGAIIEYLGYLSLQHIIHYGEIQTSTYSTGGVIINFLLLPVAAVVIIIAFIVLFSLTAIIIRSLYIIVKEAPNVIRNEAVVLRQIWENRGIGKFQLFGGLSFYLHLRQRVVAYLLACLSIGIIAWYFVFTQHEYEKTYWKIHFYRNEPTPEFIFKPNISYTFESSADLHSILLNDYQYIVSKYMDLEDNPAVLSLIFPDKWHVKFPDTTRVQFIFYTDPINEIFSQSFELWADKEEGLKITYNDFIFEGVKQYPKTKRYTRTRN